MRASRYYLATLKEAPQEAELAVFFDTIIVGSDRKPETRIVF